MKNDNDIVMARITPGEMFRMIEDFADALMEITDPSIEDRIHVLHVTEQIMNLLREENMDGRLGIIMMLENACAMYQTAVEPPCPKEHLN